MHLEHLYFWGTMVVEHQKSPQTHRSADTAAVGKRWPSSGCVGLQAGAGFLLQSRQDVTGQAVFVLPARSCVPLTAAFE